MDENIALRRRYFAPRQSLFFTRPRLANALKEPVVPYTSRTEYEKSILSAKNTVLLE